MTERNEPQSYGSQGEWLSGKTGQKVDAERGGVEGESAQRNGGLVSGSDEPEARAPSGAAQIVKTGRNVSGSEGGAKRGGYFKDRDYESKE